MKKVLLLAVAGVFVLGLSSCKKEWDCQCKVAGITVTTKTAKLSKADAKTACETNTQGVCELK